MSDGGSLMESFGPEAKGRLACQDESWKRGQP
jgi:hypothetical protein